MSLHHRSALAASGAALATVLLAAACASNNAPAAVTALSSSAAPSATVTSAPASVTPTATGLPGSLYYLGASDRLIRFHSGHSTTVLPHFGFVANVSPNGTAIATIDDTGTLLVTDGNGGNVRHLTPNLVDVGYEPAWSPDSTKVLVAQGGTDTVPGVVDIATGTFTPLAHNPGGIHYLWAADGNHLAYATGTCQIGIADSDGGNAHLIPILGSPDHAANPTNARSCDPYSVSPDASRIAVDLHTGDMPDGDIGRNLRATAVIDTTTGHAITLPVHGTLTAAFYEPDGSLLLRTTRNHVTTLTLLAPNNTVTAQVTEPASLSSSQLLAYVNH